MNVTTDGGLRSVFLEGAGWIRLLNPKLDAELHKALAVLATAHEIDKKTVSLDFRGEGNRNVRVGYIEETPIWKTSYRLVLSDEKKPFLQGWAIVENPSEEDWNDVRLSLVSGRPISFTMDLYQPTYIPRPPGPPGTFQLAGPANLRAGPGQKRHGIPPRGRGRSSDGPRAGGHARAPMAAMAMRRRRRHRLTPPASGGPAVEPRRGRGVGGHRRQRGRAFQYAIRTPVTLSRHESAMLPILNSDVKAEKFSIYNPAVQPKHPLNGLKLTNSTDLHLMQGPITVFDADTYAGDAMIQDIPPGSERLISYALDLDTEVAPESKGHPEQITSVRIAKGTLIIDRKFTRSQEYIVKNSGKKAKKVLIEYAFDPNWTLVAAQAAGRKDPRQVSLRGRCQTGRAGQAGGRGRADRAADDRPEQFGRQHHPFYIRSDKVSDKVKAALANLIKQKQAIQEVAQKRGQLEQQLRSIVNEQARIREDMGKLDHATDLYKRYVKKLNDQEDEIEKLHPQIKELQDRENQLRKSLDDFLLGLDAG